MTEKTPVTADMLRAACNEDAYESRLAEPEVFPSDAQWKYITDFAMERLAPRLYRKYLVAWLTPESERTDYHHAALANMSIYLQAITRRVAVDTVYADITSSPEATLALIDEARLFDAPTLSRLVDEGCNGFVARALSAFQPEYRANDLLTMLDLAVMLEHPSPLGEVRQVRGLFREETRFVCPNGHANPVDEQFCREPGCGLDIFGLTADDHRAIADFSRRIKILKYLLEKNDNNESNQ